MPISTSTAVGEASRIQPKSSLTWPKVGLNLVFNVSAIICPISEKISWTHFCSSWNFCVNDRCIDSNAFKIIIRSKSNSPNSDERKDFYRCISRGLQRPLFSVYRRVIRMYDAKNHIGKYTDDEVERLKELREEFGSDWAKIGAAMGRSAASVKDRCRLIKVSSTDKIFISTCTIGGRGRGEIFKRWNELFFRFWSVGPSVGRHSAKIAEKGGNLIIYGLIHVIYTVMQCTLSFVSPLCPSVSWSIHRSFRWSFRRMSACQNVYLHPSRTETTACPEWSQTNS